MRTQTLLIAAASALAAAITSSQAQTVYSANIVGYVNEVLPVTPGNFSLVVTPLQGATNNAEDVLSCVQPGDTIFLWTGSTFNSFIYAPGANDANTIWIDGSSYADVSSPQLTPGEAVFYENNQAGPETNTYTGNVVLSNSIALPVTPGNFSFVGSTVPIGGDIDSTNFNLPVQPGDTVFTWGGSAFNSYIYAPGANDANTVWIDGNTYADAPDPQLSVGQGFFYENNQASAETWIQNDSYINP